LFAPAVENSQFFYIYNNLRITKDEAAYRMREFGRRNFCRSFNLGDSINKDEIKAEYLNGILTVSLPKKEEVKITKEVQVM